MDTIPTTNKAPGDPLSAKSKVLETGAAVTQLTKLQDLGPVKHICAHLNAFHAYADEPGRCVEANHYCSHLNEDVRQCILYDSPTPPAPPEYMITPRLYANLPPTERSLWHSHVFEVKSGMLVMPTPSTVPESAWEVAETKEMEQVIKLYGKVYHLWQVDKGDQLPLGEPKLMTSFTEEGQIPGGFEKVIGERDERFGCEWRRKRECREGIEMPEVHEDADAAWK
ncbi:DUF1264-domain-containing protein [Lepidopterella palustris CBS 459.81]|uniref:DUF1264-domain-containing protein n=1 Tax=Lepidopterella palustris CBS 459.81 TaxID=1314670 RepID=A0A8E2JFB4_9PEZI|nr:DUF1264-domain-containing protein [Lepidopterella palustris CBS 459.81]